MWKHYNSSYLYENKDGEWQEEITKPKKISLLHGDKKMFKRSEEMKKINKKTFFAAAILHSLWEKVVKSETTSFHDFSPEILKILRVLTLDFEKWGQKDR